MSNTPRDHDERLWQAQERARIAARDGHGDADVDDLRIARALRHAPPVDLPTDFAARVAGLARAQALAASRFEHMLLRALVLAFALSAAVVVAWMGRGWMDALAQALPGGMQAVGWGLAAGACLLGNWVWGIARDCMRAPRHRLA